MFPLTSPDSNNRVVHVASRRREGVLTGSHGLMLNTLFIFSSATSDVHVQLYMYIC
jgi:hypothetical protein